MLLLRVPLTLFGLPRPFDSQLVYLTFMRGKPEDFQLIDWFHRPQQLVQDDEVKLGFMNVSFGNFRVLQFEGMVEVAEYKGFMFGSFGAFLATVGPSSLRAWSFSWWWWSTRTCCPGKSWAITRSSSSKARSSRWPSSSSMRTGRVLCLPHAAAGDGCLAGSVSRSCLHLR